MHKICQPCLYDSLDIKHSFEQELSFANQLYVKWNFIFSEVVREEDSAGIWLFYWWYIGKKFALIL